MPTTAPLAESAIDRPLRLRVRPDLVIRLQHFRAKKHWVVKDPMALTFFHLTEEEYAVLQMIDGKNSLQDVQTQFEKKYAPQRARIEDLQNFLGQLHRNGLLLSEATGQGSQLLSRAFEKKRRTWLTRFNNLLSIRLRGINAEPLLDWLYPLGCGLFSRAATVVWLLLVTTALVLVTVHFDTLEHKLPTAQAFFGPENSWLLVATLIAVKILHELGHALACRHYGGACHEIGVQFLVFAPCLYCDVTDAWLFPNKWQRIAVSIMGMYVETWLAAICTLMWWTSEPGLLNSICLNVMFVCSVATLFFNANPLLRYDGYYLFSDLIESPNLDTRSRAAVNRLLANVFLGIHDKGESTFVDDRMAWLPWYAIASAVYRMLILVAVYLFLVRIFEPYHVAFLADAILVIALMGALAAPTVTIWKIWSNPLMRRRIRPERVRTSATVLLVIAVAICLVPLPFRVHSPVMLEPAGAQRAYVTVGGTLLASVQSGDTVIAGQTLIRLENPDLSLRLLKLQGDRTRQRLQLDFLENRRGTDPEKAAAIPAAKELLTDLEGRIEQLQQQIAQLEIKATTAGSIMRPPRHPETRKSSDQLVSWTGFPFDKENIGCYLPEGTFVGMVGDPAKLEAVAILEQSDVDFVAIGAPVFLRFDQLPGTYLEGVVREIAKINLQDDALPFVAAGKLPARMESGTRARPLLTSYQLHIEMTTGHSHLLPSAFGEAKIVGSPQSLGQRLYRYLARTFRIKSRS